MHDGRIKDGVGQSVPLAGRCLKNSGQHGLSEVKCKTNVAGVTKVLQSGGSVSQFAGWPVDRFARPSARPLAPNSASPCRLETF